MRFLSRMPRRRLPEPFASARGANKATNTIPPPDAVAAAAAATRDSTNIKRWSSSGFAAGDHTGAAAEMPSLPSAFPWREAPDITNIRGLVERAMYSYMQHQHRRFLRAASRLNDSDDETFLVSGVGFAVGSSKGKIGG